MDLKLPSDSTGPITVLKSDPKTVTMKVGEEVVRVSADRCTLQPPVKGTSHSFDCEKTAATNVNNVPNLEQAATQFETADVVTTLPKKFSFIARNVRERYACALLSGRIV